jgi:hypothetical protein
MTEFTTTQLATILSALAGSKRKPATKATAMRAIARQASAIDLTSEAVLAAAPGLLDGRHDPATWREQLTAPVRPADTDGGELADGEGWPRRKPVGVTFRPGTKQALIAATGWLPHTTRAALTGLRRKGCTLEKSTRTDGKTAYRTVPPGKAAAGGAAPNGTA